MHNTSYRRYYNSWQYRCQRVLIFLLLSLPLSAQSYTDKLLAITKSYVGVRELTGNNDGEPIETWQRFSGGSKGEPYCIYYLTYCSHLAGMVWTPKTGYTPTLFADKKYNVSLSNLQAGDFVGLYFPSKKRLAHGLMIVDRKGNYYFTREANTQPDAEVGSEADRNGDGVYNRRRNVSLIEYKNNKASRYTIERK